MTIDERYRFSYGTHGIDIEKAKQEPKTGHYKDRCEQRKVTEVMNALLLPLLPYLSSETAVVVKRALYLLGKIDIEPQERSDKE